MAGPIVATAAAIACIKLPSRQRCVRLTRHSSGLAYGQPLTFTVSPLSNHSIQPIIFSPVFTFASINLLGVFPCVGLRLGIKRKFEALLASSACAASASSYHFASTAPLQWRSAFSQFAHVVSWGFSF